jgi:outer membrane protein TolC
LLISIKETHLSRCAGALVIWFVAYLSTPIVSLAADLDAGNLTFTLTESIQHARRHNLKIKTLIDKLALTKKLLRSARPVGLPQVSLNSNYTYAKDLPKSIIDFGENSPFAQMRGTDFPPGQTPLPTREDNDESNITELEFGAHHTFQGGLSLVQPLFAWGRYYYSYQSAKLAVAAGKSELDTAYNQLGLDVANAFYRLLLSMEFVKVAKQTVNLAKQQLKTSDNLLKSGVSTNFDVIRAQVQVANAQSTYIRSKNGVKLAKNSFKNMLNLDLATDIEISGQFRRQPVEPTLDELIDLALNHRPDLQQLDLLKKSAQKRVQVTQANARPNLSFLANYRIDDNEKLVEMNKIWNVGLSLNFPIFDGLVTYYRVQEAKSGVNQLALQHSQLQDGIEQEVRAAYLQILEAETLTEVQKETVDQAKEGVRLANLQYKNGLITSVQLTDAQLALTQAEVNRLQAQHDYSIALARLEKAIGQPLSSLEQKSE